MSASSRFNAKQIHATGKDEILDALREGAHEDSAPSFAASSSALQAANSVMLANMRARLGKDTPTPSAVYAAAMAQMQASQNAAQASTAVEPEPKPRPAAIEALAEAIQEEEDAGEAVPTASAYEPESMVLPAISPHSEGSALLAVEHTPAQEPAYPAATISPAAERRDLPVEKSRKFGRKKNRAETTISASVPLVKEPVATTHAVEPAVMPAAEEKKGGDFMTLPPTLSDAQRALLDSEAQAGTAASSGATFIAEPSMTTAPEVRTEPATLTPPAAEGVDTQAYAEESETTYREWQGALPPAQRSGHKIALFAVLGLAILVNMVFFLRSGPTGPDGHPSGTHIVQAEVARAENKLASVKQEVKGLPEKIALLPVATPQPKMAEATPAPKVAAPVAAPILPPASTNAPQAASQPAAPAAVAAAPVDYSAVVPPRVAREDAPMPPPHAPNAATPLDSKQLLRVLSRP